jgi:hypothetical protein
MILYVKLRMFITKINRINFILCLISTLISITYIVLSVCKSDDTTVDAVNMLGVMVGVLAFLVTLLIGF